MNDNRTRTREMEDRRAKIMLRKGTQENGHTQAGKKKKDMKKKNKRRKTNKEQEKQDKRRNSNGKRTTRIRESG